MKTLKESLFTHHITYKPERYIEPYNKQINVEDLTDGDYFAVMLEDGDRLYGIFRGNEPNGQYLPCYCMVGLVQNTIYTGHNKCQIFLASDSKIEAITPLEKKKLDDLYSDYIKSKK